MMARPFGPGGAAGRNVTGGLTGDQGGIKSFAHLYSLLDSRYLGVSYALPPRARKNRGTRTVAIVPNNVFPTLATFAAGTVTITFPPGMFRVTPFVTHSVIGSPLAGTPGTFISNLSPSSVQISSTDNTDVRTLHVVAFDPEAFGGQQNGFPDNVLP